MPAYKTQPLPTALYPGDSFDAIKAEKPANNTASERVSLAYYGGDYSHASKLAVQVVFDGAPGAFEIDVQLSDDDVDAHFVSHANTVSAVNANNVARLEFANTIVAKFARLFTKTANANNVNCTATISR